MTENDLDDIETLKQDIKQLDAAGDDDALAGTLADAVAASERDDLRAEWVDRLETLYDENETEPFGTELARALSTVVDDDAYPFGDRERTPDAIESVCDRVADLHDEYQNDRTAESYAAALSASVTAHGEAGQLDQIAETIQEFRRLHEEYREQAIAEHLADALVAESYYHQSLDHGDLGETHSNLQFVDNLSREYPGRELAERLAAALCWAAHASYDQGDYDDVRRKANRIEGLYQQYPGDEMAYWLVEGSHPKVWVDCRNDDFDAVEEAIEETEELVEDHDHEDLPGRLAHHYRNASYIRFDADDPRKGEKHLDRMRRFYEANSDTSSVPKQYANTLRRATEYYFEDGDIEMAVDRLEQLDDLFKTHTDEDTGIPKRYARALKSAVETRDERGDDDLVDTRFDQLRALVEQDPKEVAEYFGEATEVIALSALDDGDIETARTLVEEFSEVASESSDRLLAAELQGRVSLAEGEWGFEDGAYDVTVEAEDETELTLTIVDTFGIEHNVTVEPDGYVTSNTGKGDLPQEWSDLSPFQQVLGGRVRGFAYRWAEHNTEMSPMDDYKRLDAIETVRDAVASLSVEEIESEFGAYIDQHASHFTDGTPFVEDVDRPVDPLSVDLDENEVRYELWVTVEDGELAVVSDVQVAVYDDDDDRDEVVSVDQPAAYDALARLSLEPRPMFTPEHGKDVIVNHLTSQLRDRYIDYGQEPPAAARVLGPGVRRLSSLYDGNTEVPNFHDPGAEIPGYEQGRTDRDLISQQVHRQIRQEFIDEARTISDAYSDAPVVDTTAPETTNPEEAGTER